MRREVGGSGHSQVSSPLLFCALCGLYLNAGCYRVRVRAGQDSKESIFESCGLVGIDSGFNSCS